LFTANCKQREEAPMLPSNTAQMGPRSREREPIHRRRARARAAIATFALCAGSLIAAPVAAAAVSAPFVATEPAQHVSYASATLRGVINPHGADTSYFFQYGPTRAYGLQTGVADAGKCTCKVKVSFPVTGLQPVTKYHFRVIAVNASGASTGGDSSFTTAKVPLSLAILVAPNPVVFGGTVFVEGALSGTGNGGVPVAVQSNPFPYLQGFVTTGNAELTMANGAFSFPVLGLTQTTQFRVVTISSHPVASPVAVESVAVSVTSHVVHVGSHRARVYGVVTPAVDGAEVAILRIAHGRGVLVGGTHLRHRSAASSSYSRVVPVRGGAYRVLVRVTNGAQVSNYGRTLLIR
jgi:hypothetical protein